MKRSSAFLFHLIAFLPSEHHSIRDGDYQHRPIGYCKPYRELFEESDCFNAFFEEMGYHSSRTSSSHLHVSEFYTSNRDRICLKQGNGGESTKFFIVFGRGGFLELELNMISLA